VLRSTSGHATYTVAIKCTVLLHNCAPATRLRLQACNLSSWRRVKMYFIIIIILLLFKNVWNYRHYSNTVFCAIAYCYVVLQYYALALRHMQRNIFQLIRYDYIITLYFCKSCITSVVVRFSTQMSHVSAQRLLPVNVRYLSSTLGMALFTPTAFSLDWIATMKVQFFPFSLLEVQGDQCIVQTASCCPDIIHFHCRWH